MKTTVLLNVAEDLPARAFCICNFRDKTVVRWVPVGDSDTSFSAEFDEKCQRPGVVTHAVSFGEQCSVKLMDIGDGADVFGAVSLKPARPAEAEGDGQLDP